MPDKFDSEGWGLKLLAVVLAAVRPREVIFLLFKEALSAVLAVFVTPSFKFNELLDGRIVVLDLVLDDLDESV